MKTQTVQRPIAQTAISLLLVAVVLIACGGGDSSSGGANIGNVAANNSTDNIVTETIEQPAEEAITEVVEQPITTPEFAGLGGSLTPAPEETVVVGPNLNGFWSAEFTRVSGGKDVLRATVRHVGRIVTIQTTRKPGVANRLVGSIKSTGRMLMFDQFDNEDWTTFFGPASSNAITLADHIFKDMKFTDTNVLRLRR
jgi:hypothetical protein